MFGSVSKPGDIKGQGMLRIDENSFHCRLILKYLGEKPTTLCSYFWLFWLSVLFAILVPIFRLLKWPAILLALSLPVWSLAWLCVGLMNSAHIFGFLYLIVAYCFMGWLWYQTLKDLYTNKGTHTQARSWLHTNVPTGKKIFLPREGGGVSLGTVCFEYFVAVKQRVCPLIEYVRSDKEAPQTQEEEE